MIFPQDHVKVVPESVLFVPVFSVPLKTLKVFEHVKFPVSVSVPLNELIPTVQLCVRLFPLKLHELLPRNSKA